MTPREEHSRRVGDALASLAQVPVDPDAIRQAEERVVAVWAQWEPALPDWLSPSPPAGAVPELNRMRCGRPWPHRQHDWQATAETVVWCPGRPGYSATRPLPGMGTDNGWKPGDPCHSCGSMETGWNAVLGAHCRHCGRADSDE
jgi:hypothetical protein